MRKIYSAQVIIILIFLSGDAMSSDSGYSGPACVADFCFNKEISSLLSQKELVEKYGEGYVASKKSPVHCYEISESLYVHFVIYHGLPRKVLDIFVSKSPNCMQQGISKKSFPALVTPEGLKIGDDYEKVIVLYGEPGRTQPANGVDKIGLPYNEISSTQPFGETVLTYYHSSPRESSLHARIYIEKGKVSAINVSASP